ncbi:MAG: hypothetical protein ACXU6Q_10480 [Croceibacterium sp.]
MRSASLALALLAAFISPPVSSQSAPTEQELEQLSRKLAIDSVKLSGGHRWRPEQFPLRVAFDAGEGLQKNRTECFGDWRRGYKDYVQFINAERMLLRPTPLTSDLDVFVFFGSDDELDASPAWHLQQAWWSKPGVSVQSQWLDRYSHSYHEDYGVGQFVEFSAAFVELVSESIIRCEAFNAAAKLGAALLSDYIAYIDAQAYRLFDGRPPQTLEWRAHRRLLLA